MLASCQAMWLSAWRLSKLHEAGKMSHEQASTVKAWNTRTGREVMALGRELLGGNGIISDFLVAKVLLQPAPWVLFAYLGLPATSMLLRKWSSWMWLEGLAQVVMDKVSAD